MNNLLEYFLIALLVALPSMPFAQSADAATDETAQAETDATDRVDQFGLDVVELAS